MIEWTGGGIPFGYRYNEGKKILEVDPREFRIISEIFVMASKGKGVNLIANEMNRKGLKPRRGNSWSNTTVGYLLSEDRLNFYLGYIGEEKGNWKPLLNNTLYKLILSHKKDITIQQPVKRNKYLLPGLGVFKCGYCGGTIKSSITTTKNKKILYYTCKSRLTSGQSTCKHSVLHRQDIIDPLVMTDIRFHQNQLKVVFPKFRKNLVEQISKVANKPADTLNEIKKQNEEVSELIKLLSLSLPHSESVKSDKERIKLFIRKILLYNDRLELEYNVPIDKNFSFIKIIRLEDGNKN